MPSAAVVMSTLRSAAVQKKGTGIEVGKIQGLFHLH